MFKCGHDWKKSEGKSESPRGSLWPLVGSLCPALMILQREQIPSHKRTRTLDGDMRWVRVSQPLSQLL